jgi:exopolyphosphatase/guanosine-5'-triphosphate,3'-diphosphate pyrophosphatase
LPLSGESVVLIDVGGGSTEIAISESGQIADSISIPIGALKLREKVMSRKLEDYLQFVRPIFAEALGNFKAPPDLHLVATGGTITSAAAIVFGGKEYNSSAVHGRELDTGRMLSLSNKFEKAAPENQQELIPFDPDRADLILPGLGIFLAVLGIFRKDRVVVSAGGLRFGAALYPEKIRA